MILTPHIEGDVAHAGYFERIVVRVVVREASRDARRGWRPQLVPNADVDGEFLRNDPLILDIGRARVGWLSGCALCIALLGCIEPARSADVPPELAARLAASSTAAAATRAEDTADAVLASSGLNSVPGQRVERAASSPSVERDTFFDTDDAPVREALASRNIAHIEKGRGGRSLGFRITLEGGQQGYFKPEQTFSAANWYGEVAAYHLDRMLGMGRVPAVISRSLPWQRLATAAGEDARRAEVIVRNGQVRGAFVAWISGKLQPLDQKEGWERWLRVKYWPSTAISPFQRPAVWKHELDQVRVHGGDFRSKEERLRRRNLRPEPDRADRPAELSDLIVFDYLTRNLDRWGGENGNVLVRDGAAGSLVFLDNGAGFEPGQVRPSLMEARLHVLQRFRRRTIQAVRAFDLKRFEARLLTESLAPVLTRAQLNAVETRRKALLDWVSEMEASHGEAIWAWE